MWLSLSKIRNLDLGSSLVARLFLKYQHSGDVFLMHLNPSASGTFPIDHRLSSSIITCVGACFATNYSNSTFSALAILHPILMHIE